MDRFLEGTCDLGSNRLEERGVEVLFDDRDESPGVKFNDADLLGIPIRVTISPRSLNKDSIEVKQRSEKDSQFLPLGEAAAKIEAMVSAAEAGPELSR